MKKINQQYLVIGLCALSIMALFLPLVSTSTNVDIMGVSGGGKQNITGSTAIQEHAFGFLLIVGPIVLAVLDRIKPLEKYKRILSIAIPAICLIILILIIAQAKSASVSAGSAYASVDTKVLPGIGAILAGLSYIVCAVIGAKTHHGISFDKVDISQLKAEGLNIIEKAQESVKGGTELTKLNSQIFSEEKAIDKAYQEIGKKYMELHAADKEDAFAELVSAIEKSKQNIQNYRKQIQILKGIRVCSKCGAEVPPGSAFCNSCGNPMPKDIGDMVKCQNCGNMIPKDKKFCSFCGSKVEIPAPVKEEKLVCPGCGCQLEAGMAFCCECGTPLNNAVPAIEKTEPVVRKCPNCGSELEEGTAFCMECGTKL